VKSEIIPSYWHNNNAYFPALIEPHSNSLKVACATNMRWSFMRRPPQLCACHEFRGFLLKGEMNLKIILMIFQWGIGRRSQCPSTLPLLAKAGASFCRRSHSEQNLHELSASGHLLQCGPGAADHGPESLNCHAGHHNSVEDRRRSVGGASDEADWHFCQ
jgi:hypothetical protein